MTSCFFFQKGLKLKRDQQSMYTKTQHFDFVDQSQINSRVSNCINDLLMWDFSIFNTKFYKYLFKIPKLG